MKQNKTLVIVILLVVVTFMGIGYAALSQALRVQGAGTIDSSSDWDVKITNVGTPTINGTAVSETPVITNNDGNNVVTFASTLNKPGDYVIYSFTITNSGNIDATLNALTPTVGVGQPVSWDVATSNGIVYTLSGISLNDNILRTATKTFTLKVGFDETIETLPASQVNETFNLLFNFVQCSVNCT